MVLRGLRYLGKLIVKPYILLPLIYMLVNIILPPDYSGVVQYILNKKHQISITNLAIVDNLSGILYYFFFLWLLPRVKNQPLWKLFLWANIARLSNLASITVFFEFPIVVQYFTRFLGMSIGRLTTDFFLVPLVGRVSKHLPEGFESTGVVVIAALVNFAGLSSSALGVQQ